jgi:hypothetical protein
MAKFLNVLGACPDSRESSVGMAKGYRLDGRDSIPGRGKKLLSSTQELYFFREVTSSNLCHGIDSPKVFVVFLSLSRQM